MPSTKATMQRKEIKYKLNSRQREALLRVIGSRLSAGAYAGSQVNSIYLDTAQRDVISRSLEKPLYKEKLRVRWYGATSLEGAQVAFVELKKKYKGIVYKRRVKVAPSTAWAFATGVADAQALGGTQIARELSSALDRAGRIGKISPSVCVSCQRRAFGTDDAGGLRVTFDEGLQALDLMGQLGTVSLLDEGCAVMEVKCAGAYPLWLAHALSECEAYPTSFSKYGEFYKLCKEPAGVAAG